MSTEWSLPFRFSDQNCVSTSHLSHTCCMHRSSHPPWCDHPNNIWWSVQVMKLLNMQSSLVSCHFLPLRSKYYDYWTNYDDIWHWGGVEVKFLGQSNFASYRSNPTPTLHKTNLISQKRVIMCNVYTQYKTYPSRSTIFVTVKLSLYFN
jgi:hypothetical protein